MAEANLVDQVSYANGSLDLHQINPSSRRSSCTSTSSSRTFTGSSCTEVDGRRITREIHLGLQYKDGNLCLTVKKLIGMQPNDTGIFVKMYLLPKTKKKETKRKTKSMKDTFVYSESFQWPVEMTKLNEHTLLVSVWKKRTVHKKFLGETRIQLISHDLSEERDLQLSLKDEGNAGLEGAKMNVGLKLEIGGEISNKSFRSIRATLYVKINETRGLSTSKHHGLPSPYVNLYLRPDKSSSGKRKTPVRQDESHPCWRDETPFTYEVPNLKNLREKNVLEITVKDDLHNNVIGGLRLGPIHHGSLRMNHKWMDSLEEEAAHWQEMLNKPGEWVECWHDLRPNLKVLRPNKKLPSKAARPVSPAICEERESALTGSNLEENAPQGQLRLDMVDQSEVLEIDDSQEVYEEVIDLAHIWDHFGLALNVPPCEIRVIKKNHQDVRDCLREVVNCWLERNCTKKYIAVPPTWRALVQAINARGGGNNPALALKVAINHPLKFCHIQPLATPEEATQAVPNTTLATPEEATQRVPNEDRKPLVAKRKVIMLGDIGVGKTSLITAFRGLMGITPQWNDLTEVILDTSEGTDICLQIWEPAGLEARRNIPNQFYRGVDGVMLIFDIAQPSTFDSIEQYWLPLVEDRCPNIVRLLVGNKSDLRDVHQTDQTRYRRFAQEHGMKYMEISAKENIDVQDAFQDIGTSVYSDFHCSDSWHIVKRREILNSDESLDLGAGTGGDQQNRQRCC